MGTRENGQCFFPLTSLQIGDLQSYRSHLTLFLACESDKFFILVDNRPWLIDLDSRAAHLWQLMVTKSRLSPFAHTKVRRERKDFGNRFNLKGASSSSTSKYKKFKRWFTSINAAALSRKKVLLPMKKLRNSVLLNSELHQTLYGFIVFEVAWTDARGINYLNELQTDTSMAIEAKFMKRWEFDSIEQALGCISSWFSGTHHERILLRECLDSIIGEVFYDAQEDFSMCNPTSDGGGNKYNDDDYVENNYTGGLGSNFSVYPSSVEYGTDLLHTPPPPTGPYKRRKIMKPISSGGEVNVISEEIRSEIINSPGHLDTLTSTNISDKTVEATQYRDVLILFRFNDRDLPFKLKEIIMSDLWLLTLLESGIPSWVIFLQSYPVFCHLYRPWMCPLVRALYVLISIVTVLIGFYDLYKNVPVLKATASRLCGPLFHWIETWEMISRIKYLGTMLVLHNFEKAVRWFLMITHAIKSFISVLMQPIEGPLMEFVGFLLPFWNISLQAIESFCSVVGIAIGSSYSLVTNIVEILLTPIWFILSIIWSIAWFLASSIIYPIFWSIWEILYTPIRLVLALARFVAFVFSCIFDLLGEIWLCLSSIFQLASASEATISTYEVSIWRSLWNDLFSQVFRAIRSIVNGFVAFFAACNRHRLSIYNHILEFFLRLSCLVHRFPRRDSTHRRQTYGAKNIPESRRKARVN